MTQLLPWPTLKKVHGKSEPRRLPSRGKVERARVTWRGGLQIPRAADLAFRGSLGMSLPPIVSLQTVLSTDDGRHALRGALQGCSGGQIVPALRVVLALTAECPARHGEWRRLVPGLASGDGPGSWLQAALIDSHLLAAFAVQEPGCPVSYDISVLRFLSEASRLLPCKERECNAMIGMLVARSGWVERFDPMDPALPRWIALVAPGVTTANAEVMASRLGDEQRERLWDVRQHADRVKRALQREALGNATVAGVVAGPDSAEQAALTRGAVVADPNYSGVMEALAHSVAALGHLAVHLHRAGNQQHQALRSIVQWSTVLWRSRPTKDLPDSVAEGRADRLAAWLARHVTPAIHAERSQGPWRGHWLS